MRAADLARLLRTTIFDTEDAAQFLGIEPEGVTQAAKRGRLSYVQYRGLKLFARSDLLEYLQRRGPGRASELIPGTAHVVSHDDL